MQIPPGGPLVGRLCLRKREDALQASRDPCPPISSQLSDITLVHSHRASSEVAQISYNQDCILCSPSPLCAKRTLQLVRPSTRRACPASFILRKVASSLSYSFTLDVCYFYTPDYAQPETQSRADNEPVGLQRLFVNRGSGQRTATWKSPRPRTTRNPSLTYHALRGAVGPLV